MENKLSNIPIVNELCRMTDNMYRLGWDERNGGNVSILLYDGDILPYISRNYVGRADKRVFHLGYDASPLAGRFILVTATGHYFRNISRTPESSLGVLRISDDGKSAECVWGFNDGGAPTSELASHLMTHIARLSADKEHTAVMHVHPTNIVAMTYVHTLDEKAFTRSLWKRHTECMMVFPEGVAVLPWMLFGCDSLGVATAQKMRDFRLVVWAHHGILGTGRTLDDAFGLIECAEKAAEIYIKTASLPILNDITNEQLRATARHFGVTPKDGWLE